MVGGHGFELSRGVITMWGECVRSPIKRTAVLWTLAQLISGAMMAIAAVAAW